MRDTPRLFFAASVLLASVAIASAQTGGSSSGGSSAGGASAGSSSSGAASGGSSRGGTAQSGVRGSSSSVQTPSLRIQSPSANTSTRPSVHPTQRTDPSATAKAERQQKEQQEKQVLGSGGTPPGSAGGLSGGAAGGGASGGLSESQPGGSLLNLTAAEKEKVRRVIRTYSITPSDNTNFTWRPGALIPANVSLRPLPADLKDIIPDYQNFSYVMAGNRTAIVITEKREIDVVI
jgi:hypothetical protein